MEEQDVLRLYETSERLTKHSSLLFRRYLCSEINWGNRLICLRGAKGVGKTTLLLQHIKETFGTASDRALYVSVDNIWFSTHDLQDLADWHWKHGGTHLFLDEVHYYPRWQTVIKNLYDSYPDLHIVYTGSSLLQLEAGSGDLSRRRIAYTLYGLSFREYLTFEGITVHEAVKLDVLLAHHQSIASEICSAIRPLKYFSDYLKHGYYPFYKEGLAEFPQRLSEMINQVLERDYPAIEEVTLPTIFKAKKMLSILAESVPQTPNMSQLFAELETDRNQGMKILTALARAGMLGLLSCEKASLKAMSKPDKILLDNTCLMHAMAPAVDRGTMRETFFLNQLRQDHKVTYPPAGDMLVDDKWLFEIGRAGKNFTQIRNVPDSHLAVDDIEVGRGSRLPLWLFGFLY